MVGQYVLVGRSRYILVCMKLTDEEKRILCQFTGFLAALTSDEGPTKESADAALDLVEMFEGHFNTHAELMRAPKTADTIRRLARESGTEGFLNEYLAGDGWQPVVACATITEPHDHSKCKNDA